MRTLAASPSSGEFETLAALYQARAHNGNYVAAARLKRFLPTRVPLTDITTVLGNFVGANIQTDGSGKYRLSAAGVARARSHKPRRWLSM